ELLAHLVGGQAGGRALRRGLLGGRLLRRLGLDRLFGGRRRVGLGWHRADRRLLLLDRLLRRRRRRRRRGAAQRGPEHQRGGREHDQHHDDPDRAAALRGRNAPEHPRRRGRRRARRLLLQLVARPPGQVGGALLARDGPRANALDERLRIDGRRLLFFLLFDGDRVPEAGRRELAEA